MAAWYFTAVCTTAKSMKLLLRELTRSDLDRLGFIVIRWMLTWMWKLDIKSNGKTRHTAAKVGKVDFDFLGRNGRGGYIAEEH